MSKAEIPSKMFSTCEFKFSKSSNPKSIPPHDLGLYNKTLHVCLVKGLPVDLMCVMCTLQAAPSCMWEQRSYAKVCIQHLPYNFSCPDHVHLCLEDKPVSNFPEVKPFCHAGPNTSAAFAIANIPRSVHRSVKRWSEYIVLVWRCRWDDFEDLLSLKRTYRVLWLKVEGI